MKAILTLMISISTIVVSCKSPGPTNDQNAVRPDTRLKTQKERIDKYFLKHIDQLLLFAQIPASKIAIKAARDKWPDDTQCSYNILKDQKGRIIMIASSPISESGDWDMDIRHYFDSNGNTLAYERKANAFALPDEGVAYETTTEYFDPNFEIADFQYKLVDKKGHPLSKNLYAFDAKSRGFDVRVYKDVAECLDAYHIKL